MPQLKARAELPTVEQHDYVALHSLPRRPHKWPGRSAAAAACGLAAGGFLDLTGHPSLAIAAGSLTALTVGTIVTFAVRDRARGRSVDPMIEAVNALNQSSLPTRDLVRVSRWRDGWIGYPEKIRVRYSATLFDTDPQLTQKIITQVSNRLGVPYVLRKNDSRRCVYYLERDRRQPEPELPEPVQRATQVVLELLGASASVQAHLSGEETPQVDWIEVKHSVGARASMGAYRDRVDKIVDAQLPGRWRSRWRLEKDEVRFELRPEMPTMIRNEPAAEIPPLTHASYMATRINYAIDEDGDNVFWQPSVIPHFLIVGGTGSGKTSAEHTITASVTQLGWRTWILDGKRIEFAGFKDWPNVELVASSVGDQVRMVHAAHDLMEERYSLIESGKARISDFDPLLLVIDEYATFRARVEAWYATVKPKGAPARASVFALIQDLARLARTAKIHMVIGIQRPDVTFLDGEMRDNFGNRLSLGRLSPQGANMMWDSYAIGVAVPRSLRGRGVALNENSSPVDVQTFYTPDPAKLTDTDEQDWAHLAALRAPTTSYPRKMILPPRTEADIDGTGDTAEPSYTDWALASIVDYDPARLEARLAGTSAGSANDIDQLLASRISAADELEEEDAESLFEGYERPDEARVNDVNPGDLVLVDETMNLWGVIEAAGPDPISDDNFALDFRHLESGEADTISVSDGEFVSVRRPSKARK